MNIATQVTARHVPGHMATSEQQTGSPEVAPVTMAGRPEGEVKLELAAGVVVRMSWVMR
jgi:hypothetical protein